MTRTKTQEAQARLTAAQAEEARAQEKRDPIAIGEAQKRQADALDALYAAPRGDGDAFWLKLRGERGRPSAT